MVLYRLTAHEIQVLALVAPYVIEYVPVGQLVHVPAPAAEYVPVAQDVHVVALAAENVPAGQHVPAPSAEYVPVAQDVHVDTEVAPIAVENLPALHAVHSDNPITSANVPAGHGVLTQSIQ